MENAKIAKAAENNLSLAFAVFAPLRLCVKKCTSLTA